MYKTEANIDYKTESNHSCDSEPTYLPQKYKAHNDKQAGLIKKNAKRKIGDKKERSKTPVPRITKKPEHKKAKVIIIVILLSFYCNIICFFESISNKNKNFF